MRKIIINSLILVIMFYIGLLIFPRLIQRKMAIDEQHTFNQITQEINSKNIITALRKKYQNNDIIGFLEIPETNIKYPITQREGDNAYYLNHGYDGKSQINGTLFLDKDNDKKFRDLNSVIYGHRMASGTLFNQLPRLLENRMYETAIIKLTTLDRVEIYRVYSIMKVSSSMNYRTTKFESQEEFNEYLEKILSCSEVQEGNNLPGPPTKIITLSTCTYEKKNYRLVVVGWLSETETF